MIFCSSRLLMMTFIQLDYMLEVGDVGSGQVKSLHLTLWSDNVTRPLIRIFPPHSTQANFCYRNAFIINTKQASKFQSDLYCFIFHNRCLKNKMMLSSFKELKQITNLYNKPISKILHIKTLQHLCKLRYK